MEEVKEGGREFNAAVLVGKNFVKCVEPHQYWSKSIVAKDLIVLIKNNIN